MTASLSEASQNGERQIVARLLSAAASAGLADDPGAIINFYVSLKCKPLLLLAGRSQSGKIALVECLALALTGGSAWQCQFMPGHAWWAGQTGNVGLFTEAQTRLNTSKILDLIEEAWRPKNTSRVFMACLNRISPAELEGFFSDTAFQLQRGELMRLPTAHFDEPVPFPPNLMLIGTIDTDAGMISEAATMPETSVIHWSSSRAEPVVHAHSSSPSFPAERSFLQSRIRSVKEARAKLGRVLDPISPLLARISRVDEALRQHGVSAIAATREETLIYLANAWDCQGTGLFDPRPAANLALALDWGLAATVLPTVLAALQRSPNLKLELRTLLNGNFPRAQAYLDQLRQLEPHDQAYACTQGFGC